MSTAPRERAAEILDAGIARMAAEFGVAPTGAARTLLGALARWFGSDFTREADDADAELTDDECEAARRRAA